MIDASAQGNAPPGDGEGARRGQITDANAKGADDALAGGGEAARLIQIMDVTAK
jgi:hypothetical protein